MHAIRETYKLIVVSYGIIQVSTCGGMCPQRRPGRPRTMKYEMELSRKTVGRDFAHHDICNTVRAASSDDSSFPIRASFYESMTREAVWECPVADVTSTVIRWSSCDT